VEITGLIKSDTIVHQIYGTFDAFRAFIPANYVSGKSETPVQEQEKINEPEGNSHKVNGGLGLSYHINIVLPETKDISVFNAIFQSLKNNLL